MKSKILTIVLFVLFMLVWFFYMEYSSDRFHSRISEIMDLSRDRLKEDGMNSSQIQTVLSAIEASVHTVCTSPGMFINILIPFLLIGISGLIWRVSVLEKELKEVKRQLDLDKSNA